MAGCNEELIDVVQWTRRNKKIRHVTWGRKKLGVIEFMSFVLATAQIFDLGTLLRGMSILLVRLVKDSNGLKLQETT